MTQKGVVMKICLKCLTEKELAEFGKDKQKKDGINPYCKSCIRKRSRKQRIDDPIYCKEYADKYREENREKLRIKASERFKENKDLYLEKSRKSYHENKLEISLRRKELRETDEAREKERIRQKEWRKNNPELYRKWVRDWQIKNREKINAHAKVNRAVKSGKLIRGEFCEICNKKCKTEGHHEDYSKPLSVNWLCRGCHARKICKL